MLRQHNSWLLCHGIQWSVSTEYTSGRWNVVHGLAENHYSATPYNYVLNNPINFFDLFGLDTVQAKNVTPAVWQAFDTKNDNIALNKVSVTASRGVKKAKAAYMTLQAALQGSYRKRSGGLFMGYPDNLQDEISSKFKEAF